MDTGIRNAVFSQFASLAERSDTGALVESFVFSELVKKFGHEHLWFYRTDKGSEVDFLLQRSGSLFPIEVKFSQTKQNVVPKVFTVLAKALDIKLAFVLTKDVAKIIEANGIKVKFMPVWDINSLDLETQRMFMLRMGPKKH